MSLCECGCGQETVVYRGNPRRFITGHNRRGVAVSVEHRANLSKSLEGHIKSDAHRDAIAKAKTGIPLSDSHKKALSEAGIRSEQHKIATEKQFGGHDIVNHHLIYDHSDLTKHTMPMTRSMHTRLHRLFQKHGIGIPHINEVDDG